MPKIWHRVPVLLGRIVPNPISYPVFVLVSELWHDLPVPKQRCSGLDKRHFSTCVKAVLGF